MVSLQNYQERNTLWLLEANLECLQRVEPQTFCGSNRTITIP